jgi:hypothetical protein
LNKEELPQQWEESIIVLIYRNSDISDCSNYRGISVLPATYKILSDILASSLSPYVDDIIGDVHCGFRRNKSTIDQIFCICQIVEKKNVSLMG